MDFPSHWDNWMLPQLDHAFHLDDFQPLCAFVSQSSCYEDTGDGDADGGDYRGGVARNLFDCSAVAASLCQDAAHHALPPFHPKQDLRHGLAGDIDMAFLGDEPANATTDSCTSDTLEAQGYVVDQACVEEDEEEVIHHLVASSSNVDGRPRDHPVFCAGAGDDAKESARMSNQGSGSKRPTVRMATKSRSMMQSGKRKLAAAESMADVEPAVPSCKGGRTLLPVVLPFTLLKPCGIQGDATLKDINQKINDMIMCSSSSSSSSFLRSNLPPSQTPLTSHADVDVDAAIAASSSSSCSLSPFSRKSVLAVTKIHTQGNGSITILRTRN